MDSCSRNHDRDGNPYQAILSYSTANDIDLVVMRTHGRTGIPRDLLGSVTENVIRTSALPVLSVREAK
ncbi:universal stress protein [Natronoglomus mannanivorans]|uniref:universal stress protein n=1 Tax=Natronoglomus mannanivorans TaxID=2979990 RepID=UPI003082ECBD